MSEEEDEGVPPVAVDARQRMVAAYMILAFDLPAEMGAAAASMIEAAKVAPGLTTADIGGMGTGNRLRLLYKAKELIDAMIEEAPHT